MPKHSNTSGAEKARRRADVNRPAKVQQEEAERTRKQQALYNSRPDPRIAKKQARKLNRASKTAAYALQQKILVLARAFQADRLATLAQTALTIDEIDDSRLVTRGPFALGWQWYNELVVVCRDSAAMRVGQKTLRTTENRAIADAYLKLMHSTPRKIKAKAATLMNMDLPSRSANVPFNKGWKPNYDPRGNTTFKKWYDDLTIDLSRRRHEENMHDTHLVVIVARGADGFCTNLEALQELQAAFQS